MKKISYLLLILLTSFTLISCKKEEEIDFKPIIDELSDIYNNDDSEKSVRTNLNLKNELKDYKDLEINWVSSNLDVLSNDGLVNRLDEDVNVELTLHLKYKNQETKKTFNLTIIKKDQEDIYYEVIFLIDNIEYKKDLILKGEKLEKPNNPEKEGYNFIGWYKDDKEFDFDKVVTENIKLIAKFEKELSKYKITYIVDNIKYDESIVIEGEKLEKPNNPKKEGYSFIGWYEDDKEFDFNQLITKDTILVAKFEINVFEVIFLVDDNIYLTKEVKYGTRVSMPDNPKKEGYNFIGWYKDDKEFDFNSILYEGISIKAKFEKEENKVSIINIGGKDYLIDDIKNKNVVNTDSKGAILFEEDEPIKIYDKIGYETIVKKWDDVFFNNTVFAVIENGYVLESYMRNGNYVMNSKNTNSLINKKHKENISYWKNLNMTNNSYLVIAQNQKDYSTKDPIHDETYFNELINLKYNDRYNRIKIGDGTISLPNKVIRNGKVLKDHLGNEIYLPEYEEKDQVRAVWISTVWNLDLPKFTNIDQYKKDIINVLNQIESLKFNTVFLQVRAMNDSLYPSKLAPFTRFINGTEGFDPGFDILRFFIDEAHKRDLELHAWLNPYRVSTSKEGYDAMSRDNFARKNPHLVISKNNSYILNPGEEEVQKYIVDIVDEILTNYNDIDGIHFDDYFYLNTFGENTSSPDYDTYLKNRLNSRETIADYRRRSVNIVIKNVFEVVDKFNKNNNKSVKFGVAPTGIWKNGGKDGSATKGQQHYSDLYADSKKWVEEGWLHYIMPQLYWPFDKFDAKGNPVAPFANLVHWWNDLVEGTNVSFIVGQGFYRQNPKEWAKDWHYKYELLEQLRYIQQFKNVKGVSIFTYNTFNLKNDEIQDVIKELNMNYWTKKVKPVW